MIIKELTLIHFGKFHDMHIEFGPSMNIIYGPKNPESRPFTVLSAACCLACAGAEDVRLPQMTIQGIVHGIWREAMREHWFLSIRGKATEFIEISAKKLPELLSLTWNPVRPLSFPREQLQILYPN